MDYNVLIHKKLSGQITDEQQQKLDDWLASDPVNQNDFDEIKLIWEGAEEKEEEVTNEHFQEELLKLEGAVQESVAREKLIKNYSTRGRIKNIAIVLLLTASGYFFAAPYFKPEVTHTVFLTSNDHHKVVFSDSSLVILNDSSSISFEESSTSRRANLTGEAFFTVSKDHRPFIVQTLNATISVLGTSFVVKAYPKNPVEVYVISGRVKVSSRGKDALLSRSEKSVMGGIQGLFYKCVNADPNFNSWYTRRLEFKKTELRTILGLIEQLYHITFNVKNDKILDCRFTGTFDHAKLENVLKTLSFSMDIEFTSRIGNYYKVSGKGCVP